MRALWHQLTHRHTELVKPDIGAILLCGHRLTGRLRCVTVDVDGKGGWHLHRPNTRQMNRLLGASTAAALALAAWETAWEIAEAARRPRRRRPRRRAAHYGSAVALLLTAALVWGWLR